jgi:hypothetical protein
MYMWMAGFAAHAAVMMLYQDFHGLEGYIEIVKNGWVQLHPIVGTLLLMANLYWAWVIYRGPKRAK